MRIPSLDCRCWPAVGLLVLWCASALSPAQDVQKQDLSSLPPWQRTLTERQAQRLQKLREDADAAFFADDVAQALEIRAQALALCERVLGDDHWRTADARWELDHWRRVGEQDHSGRVAYLQAWAGGYRSHQLARQSLFDEAIPLREQLLQTQIEVLGEDHPHTARSHNNLAVLLQDQGRFAEAEAHYRRTLEIELVQLGPLHPDTAGACNNVAQILHLQGQSFAATDYLRQALEIKLGVLGESSTATALAYDNLAANLDALGRFAEAESLHRTALALWIELLGEERAETARSYGNLGENQYQLGRFAAAAPLFERALEIRRRVLGDEHADVGLGYNNLAANLNAQGRTALAAEYYGRALEIFRATVGDDHLYTLRALSNLAATLPAEASPALVQERYEAALAAAHRIFGEAHAETGRICHNYAFACLNLGDAEQAERLFRRALQIDIETGSAAHPDALVTQFGLALALQSLGRTGEAQPLLTQAWESARQALGAGHPDTARYAGALALCQMAAGDPAAVAQAQAAAESYAAARLRVAEHGLERAVAGELDSPWPLLAVAYARTGDGAAAWAALEADLARGLLEEFGVREGLTLTPEETQQRQRLLQELAALEPQIVQLVAARQATSEEQAALAQLLQARSELDAQLAALARTYSDRQVAPLAEIQAALTEDAALVAWIDVNDWSGALQEHWGCVVRHTGEPRWVRLPGAGPQGDWTADDAQCLASLRHAAASRGEPATLAELTAQTAAQRLAPLRDSLQGVRRLYVVATQTMSGLPIEVLTDALTVSYVPSGTSLARLDRRPAASDAATLLALGDAVFQSEAAGDVALPPGGLLLTEVVPDGAAAEAGLQEGDVLLTYAGQALTSVDQLSELIAAHAAEEFVTASVWRETEPVAAERVLAPGPLGVALDREGAPQAIARQHGLDWLLACTRGGWTELPGTRVELARLERLFPPQGCTLLTDSQASEQALDALRTEGALANFRYVHLATHGEADLTEAFESALILAQDQLATAEQAAAGERCYDGRLTAGEVLRDWRLNADLVTLSACESGVGRSGGGEGALGFAQALLLAGSRSVCLSLWKVDDTATALLMDRFYENLLGRRPGLSAALPKAEALAEAKRWLRGLTVSQVAALAAEMTQGVARGAGRRRLPLLPTAILPAEGEPRPFEHPYYWAAFVLIGDPD